MPQRPKAHIIGDKSVQEFGALLPEHWVFREKNKDYGIDGEVEIFTDSGDVTGWVFWVQVKGTDSQSITEQRTMKLENEKLNQLKSYPVQVMLVRYVRKTKQFFFEWVNKASILYASSNNKKISIKFPDKNIWTADTPESIINYLTKIKYVESGSMHLPIQVNVEEFEPQPKDEQLMKLRETLLKFPDIFLFQREPDNALLQVFLSNDKITLALAGEFGAAIFLEEEEKGKTLKAEYIQDCMFVGLLLIFSNLNHKTGFRKVLELLDLRKQCQHMPSLAETIAMSLLDLDELDKYLSLLNDILDDTPNGSLEIMINMKVASLLRKADQRVQNAILSFYERNLQKAVIKEDTRIYAAALQNLGIYFISRADYHKALEFLNLSRKADPNYLTLPEFLATLGELLLRCKRYRIATKLLRTSIQLGNSEKDIRGLYGDALLYSGKLWDALKQYQPLVMRRENWYPGAVVYFVKFASLVKLLELKFPATLRRYEKLAEGLVKFDCSKYPPEIQERWLRNILHLDPFCVGASFQLFKLYLELGMLKHAFALVLWHASTGKWDVEAWVSCTTLAMSHNEFSVMLSPIIKTGYHYYNEEFLDKLILRLQKMTTIIPSEILRSLDSIIGDAKTETQQIKILDQNYKTEKELNYKAAIVENGKILLMS